MSLYSFGKIISRNGTDEARSILQGLASAAGVTVTFGTLDPEDEKVFEGSSWLRRGGTVFNLVTPNDSDVGALWTEANSIGLRALHSLGESKAFGNWSQVLDFHLPEQVRQALLKTRFGQFASGLFDIKGAESVGFAIFDNAIDEIIEETPENCRTLILKTFLVPWHNGPNALFVWHK